MLRQLLDNLGFTSGREVQLAQPLSNLFLPLRHRSLNPLPQPSTFQPSNHRTFEPSNLPTFQPATYSDRSATIGSAFARCAGIQQATSATTASSAPTMMKVTGSVAPT